MKLEFEQPIVEADVVRHSITIDHVIIYPDANEVVINNRDGSSRKMPLSGFSPESMKIMDVLIADFYANVISEYTAGTVTARAIDVSRAAAARAVMGESPAEAGPELLNPPTPEPVVSVDATPAITPRE